MKNKYKNFIRTLFFVFGLKIFSAHAVILNPNDQEPPIAEGIIFQNRSILKCGVAQDETIFTLLDTQALLAISQVIFKPPVPIQTDWYNFSPPKINLYRISEKISPDVLHILYLCLNWQDAKVANLFSVSHAELEKQVILMREQKPWKIYSIETQKKINDLSDDYLSELVDIVLRGHMALRVRGDLRKNQSLKSIKFHWLL